MTTAMQPQSGPPLASATSHGGAAAARHAGLQWALIAAVLSAAALFGMALRELVDGATAPWPVETSTQREKAPVAAPATIPEGGRALRGPMSFVLTVDGTLRATGSIEQGSARALRRVLDGHGHAVRRLSLHSPGGTLDDALAMGTILRQRGLEAVVEAGAICASSCPLILAGGAKRAVEPGGRIGLHQFYSAPGSLDDPRDAMANAQLTTARIVRHLDAMGVDPALWLHALDTSPEELYVLAPAQVRRYRLATAGG